MKKILNWFTTGVIGEIGKVIDNLFTSEEERINAKNEVFKVLQEQQLELQKLQTEIIVTEANGNWLQRSWRPILMLAFGIRVVFEEVAVTTNAERADSVSPTVNETGELATPVHEVETSIMAAMVGGVLCPKTPKLLAKMIAKTPNDLTNRFAFFIRVGINCS